MRILLTTLNSKYIHSNLALKYLYAAAEGISGLEAREFTINNDDDYIYGELVSADYDVVCFSCYIWNIDRILGLAENLKKAEPRVKIIFGGPEVSFDSLEFIKEHKFIDAIIQGEGEDVFAKLCKGLIAIYEGSDDIGQIMPSIPGLLYRYEGKIFVNEKAPALIFDSVPFPYNYFPAPADQVTYYESSRGCPYNCSYCLSSIDKHVRALPIDRVKQELSYFIHKKVKQVKFIDRTFNCNRSRARDIWQYLIATDNGVTNFHFEICAELLDWESFEVLKNARDGLFQFEIGIQTTNLKTLGAIGRSMDIPKLLEAVKRVILLENIHVHVDLICGLPFEGYKSFRNSFNDVYALSAHQLQLGFLKLLKGTDIRRSADVYEYVYKSKAPYEVISNKFISAKDIVRIKRVENVLELYYNRGGFETSLEYMTATFQDTPFDFYQEFADFFYSRGYQHRSHKKEDLYRIAYEYARFKDDVKPLCSVRVQELLFADMVKSMNFDAVKKFKSKGWGIL